MNLKEMIDRANIANIHSFLTYGAEGYKDNAVQSYEKRIATAQSRISDFINKNFDDITDRDRISELIFDMTEVYEDVYFETGLLTGAKLGYEICEKLNLIKNIAK